MEIMKDFRKTKNIIIKINHPGRKEALQQFNKHCVAATPPSKGGETFFAFPQLIIVLA